MESLTVNINQAEKTVAFLQEQLIILTKLSSEKQQSNEEAEIKRISSENDALRNDLMKLKGDLRYYEAQNGVVQVTLPKSTSKQQELSNTIPDPALKQPIASNDNPSVEAEKKQPKKEKKKNDGGNKQQQAPPADAKPIDASRLNMRVGKIVSVKKHPDADGLYVEDVDVGEEKNRTIISGLVKHYTLEQMQDRMGIFLCNLKPAKMRGILSEGMIMCASSPDKVETLEIPAGGAIGDRVTCKGYEGEADPQLNPKKKIWEQIQPDLNVGVNGIPAYKGGEFTIVGKGVCTAPTMRNCMVK